MATRLPTAARNASVAGITALVDAGAGAGKIELRTGSQPTTADDAATGTLLATWTLADPAWGSPASGVAALDATPVITTVGVAAGTAGWFRMMDSSNNKVIDGSAGGPGSGAQLILDNPVIAVDQVLNLTAGSMTQPAS